MPDIYNNQTYLRNNPTWGSEDAAMKVHAITSLLKKHDIPFRSVAEAGCGSGEILVELEKQFPDTKALAGFDISADALNIASTKKTEKLQFELLDFASCDRPELYFDILLVIDVLEHIPIILRFSGAFFPRAGIPSFIFPWIFPHGPYSAKKC
jgi:ubiquinone/menaquinone biosynthesis C-methylase UbiE